MACLRKRRGKLVLDWRDGRRRRRWREFPDTKAGRREAEIALGDIQKSARAGASIDDKITVGEFVTSWLETVKPTIAEQTYDYYRQSIERLRDRHEADRLVSLNAPKLIAMATELRRTLKPSTVAQVLSVVHLCLAHGVITGSLPGNPATGLARHLKLRRRDTENIKAMTEEQLALFLRAVETLPTRLRLALQLYAHTGLRISEGLGLTVDGFDPEGRSVRVEQQRLESGCFARLKTRASRRTVELPEALCEEIRANLARRREEALAEGQAAPQLLLGPMSQETLRRAMAVAIARARLPEHFTVHCLRHTFATLHLKRGADLLWVSRQLGHSSVKITADVYFDRSVQPESPGAAEKFAERIAQKRAELPGQVLSYPAGAQK